MTVPLWVFMTWVSMVPVALVVGYFVGCTMSKPPSDEAMERRGLTKCPVCEGAGWFRDITHSHGVVDDDRAQP